MVRIIINTQDVQEGWKHVGDVSVDTGRILITDPCNLNLDQGVLQNLVDTVIQIDLQELCAKANVNFETLHVGSEEFEQVSAMRRRFGEVNFPDSEAVSVASQTGYGDGRYPVFAKVEDDRVVGLWVDFQCGQHWLDEE